jgi:hypothetical protein
MCVRLLWILSLRLRALRLLRSGMVLRRCLHRRRPVVPRILRTWFLWGRLLWARLLRARMGRTWMVWSRLLWTCRLWLLRPGRIRLWQFCPRTGWRLPWRFRGWWFPRRRTPVTRSIRWAENRNGWQIMPAVFLCLETQNPSWRLRVDEPRGEHKVLNRGGRREQPQSSRRLRAESHSDTASKPLRP